MKLEASANKEVKDSAPAEDVESNPWMQGMILFLFFPLKALYKKEILMVFT